MVDPNPFIGQIQLVGFSFAPRGWAFCEGQIMPISQHQALFSILGTTYGGDGRTTFALPDLRGRAAVHAGRGSGLSDYKLGSKGGVHEAPLTSAQLPAHTHNVEPPCDNLNQSSGKPGGKVYGADTVDGAAGVYSSTPNGTMAAFASDATGQGKPVDHMQPSLGLRFCIALVGRFPSRD